MLRANMGLCGEFKSSRAPLLPLLAYSTLVKVNLFLWYRLEAARQDALP